jgi:hypothetical protein
MKQESRFQQRLYTDYIGGQCKSSVTGFGGQQEYMTPYPSCMLNKVHQAASSKNPLTSSFVLEGKILNS